MYMPKYEGLGKVMCYNAETRFTDALTLEVKATDGDRWKRVHQNS